MARVTLLLALVLAGLVRPARGEEPPVPPAPPVPAASEPLPAGHALIRKVVRSQRAAEKRFDSYTFDQLEETTTFRSDGSEKETKRRLYYVFSGPGEGAGEGRGKSAGSRELVEVDGRPATDEEKGKAAEEDRKAKRRLEEKAAAAAAEDRRVEGDEDDPLVGSRRLSDLLGRFDVRVASREELAGRPVWVVEFSPRPGAPEKGLGDRALGALAGTAWIDVEDFQVVSVAARIVRPIKVAGGLAANLKQAEVTYEAEAVGPGYWFPARISLRYSGKKALFFNLSVRQRFVLSNFRTFRVEAEAETAPAPSPPEHRD
jgi:hypothetical protein